MRLKIFVFISLLLSVLYFLPIVSSQVKDENDSEKEKKTENVISVRAKERGFPHISLEDGKDLKADNNANQNSGSPKLLTSADFDSDGTVDLITADSTGNINFYRGNPDSIFPNSSDAQARKANGNFNEDAFAESVQSFNLPFSPDYIASGDFNADGHQDILAARNGENILYLMAGNGSGNFAAAVIIQFEGAITAFTVGEIGRRDGQTDVAISVVNKRGASLLVFEHPEGAFKYKPEKIKLISASNDLAIGNLDADFFADVAVASGNKLTLVHGRGQAYPWDLLKESDIKRPLAITETRILPFEIAAIETGYFTEKRGMSLAILTTNGTIQTLDSPKLENRSLNPQHLKPAKFAVPADKSGKLFSTFSLLTENKFDSEEDLLPADKDEREKVLQERQQDYAESLQKLSSEEKAKLSADSIKRVEESRQRAKTNFLKAISPGDSAPLNSWNLQNIISDARLSSSAVSSNNAKFTRIQVTGSSTEDLAFLDTNANKIHILARGQTTETQTTVDEIVTLDVETSPLAILPMRLNSDALTDLVVLRQGSATPSIVMTSPAQTFVVNSTADNDICDNTTCTLRGAIRRANFTNGFDTITFNIGGGGLRTITPNTNLPVIEFPMTIDATTQPGYAGFPLIEINGTNITDGGDGFQINTSFVSIRGFAINEFHSFYLVNQDRDLGGNGITIYNFANSNAARFCIISNNHLGTDSSGTIDKGNDISGLNIFDSDNNLVVSNLLSGNGTSNDPDIERKSGSGLSLIAANNTEVYDNRIGTNLFGNAKLNNSIGIFMSGNSNLIGSDNPFDGNLVSGNGDREALPGNPVNGCIGTGIAEVSVINVTTGEFITRFNNFQGNKIGTNSSGTAAIGNCSVGLATSPRHSSIVGSITESGRNIVSGNHNNGIICSTRSDAFGGFAENLGGLELPEGQCTIVGNNVGTNLAGNAAIPNDRTNAPQMFTFEGVVIVYNTETFSVVGLPGGNSPNACTGFCNLISGNTDGRPITRVSEFGQVGIFNNFIGTNRNGDAALPNDSGGLVEEGSTFVGAVGVDQNNNQVLLGNLISGNREALFVGSSFPYYVAVRNNLIGTDKTGLTAIPNGNNDNPQGSAVILNGGIVDLGGTNPLEGNVISGNIGSGVQFLTRGAGLALNNSIGVNKNGQPLGNTRDGIQIFAENVRVFNNTIANNGRNGVIVLSLGSTSFVVKRNPIRFNSIYNNGALGIDLNADTTFPIEPDGVTPNDCLDVDELANGLQNFPLLTAPVFNANGSVSLDGGLQSKPVTRFVIDYYSNATADPTNYGEGETYIGSQIVNTDSDGQVGFEFTSSVPVAPNVKITATATDVDGNTSEFSCFAGECTGGTGGLTKAEILKLLAPTCLTPIVVNINTDEPDTSPGNGICDVDTATVGSQCSLRAAIQTTNATTGFDLINFDIPGGGIQTIAPTSALPPITQQVFIDATTQPGYVSSPMVEVRGDSAGADAFALAFASGTNGSAVIALAINRFSFGIGIASSENRIERCYIGLDANGIAAGTFGGAVNQVGVEIVSISAKNNRIGGFGSSENIISNNNIGVRISQSASGNKVFGNKLGTNVLGTAAIPNRLGVFINSARNNTIGDIVSEDGNLISGNSLLGVYLGNDAANNRIIGNFIGTKANGTEVLPNGDYGIYLETRSTLNTIEQNVIGGHNLTELSAGIAFAPNAGIGNIVDKNAIGVTSLTATAAIPNKYGIANFSDGQIIGTQPGGNVIGHNTKAGIWISSTTDPANPIVENNIVQYNKIGTNGTNDIGNTEFGVWINGESQNNTVTKNIVSGNDVFGIAITDGPSSNKIKENFIGTNTSGTSAIASSGGIWIRQATNNTVESNVVSGNNLGMLIGTNIGLGVTAEFVKKFGEKSPVRKGVPSYTSENRVFGNIVGLNATRNAAIPNDIGITVGENARNNFIGSTNGSYNLISGNTSTIGFGLFLGTFSANPSEDVLPQLNTFQGNVIGLAGNLQSTIPNKVGFVLLQAKQNLIGGETDILANTIVANTEEGISIRDNSRENTFLKNYLGVLPASFGALQNVSPNGVNYGNGGDGILITNGASRNTFGGSTPNSGLIIANNGGNGIGISSTAGVRNSFGANRIYGNTLLGIDIGKNGQTPNDPTDADSGPNNLQNHPDIVSKQIVNDELILGFRVNSAPANSAYGTNGIYVEFFKADASGEGERFLGSGYYTVGDYNGSLSVKIINLGNINTLGITPSDPLTATATDALGNTSEFTPVAPTAADSSISGRVLAGNSQGLARARVILTAPNGNIKSAITNSFGYYRFEEVESGQVYIINVLFKQYLFSPQVLTVNESLESIDFYPDSQKP